MANSFEVQLKGEREGFKGSEIEVSFAGGNGYSVGRGLGPKGKPVVEISFDKGQKQVKLYNKDGLLDSYGYEQDKDGYILLNAKTIETFPDSHISIQIAGADGNISTVSIRGTDIVINNKKPDSMQVAFDSPLNVELSKNYFKDISEGKINARAFPPQIFGAIDGLEGVSAKEFIIGGNSVRLFAIGEAGKAQVYCGVSNRFLKLDEIFDLSVGEDYHTLGFRFHGGKLGDKGKVGEQNARIQGVTAQEIAALMKFVKTQAGETFVKTGVPGMQIGEENLKFAQRAATQRIVDLTKEDSRDSEILRLRKEAEEREGRISKLQAEKETEISNLRAQNQAETEKLKREAEEERLGLQKNIDVQRAEKERLEGEKRDLETKIFEKDNEIAELKNSAISQEELQRLQAEREALEARRNELSTTLEDKEKTILELQGKQRAFEEERAAWVEREKQYNEKIKELEASSTKLGEIEELIRERDFEQKVLELKQQTELLNLATRDYTNDYNNLAKKIAEYKTNRERLISDARKIAESGDIKRANELIQQANDDVRNFQSEVSKDYESITRKFGEAENIAANIEKASKEIDGLFSDIENKDFLDKNTPAAIETIEKGQEMSGAWKEKAGEIDLAALGQEAFGIEQVPIFSEQEKENPGENPEEEKPKQPEKPEVEKEKPRPPETEEEEEKKRPIEEYEKLLNETKEILDERSKMLSELQKGENEELKLKAQERNQVAQQDLNKEEKETLEREKADLQSQKVPPIRFIKKRALTNIMIVKDQQIEENAKRINETDLALNATRQQLANQERANNELESEFIPKLAGQRAELNENRVRLTELREEIMSKDPSYFGFANQSEGETGGSAGNERQKEYQNIITQINNTVNVSDNPAQAAEQEKPLEQPQQQQPKTENQPEANKVEEKKEEEEKKKKKGSPQQSKQIRGQAWRAAKYSFLGGLCGLLLLATILLGVAGMLPIFFICLACTIGACIITSGEVTSDIKKANEESLKARTEQNKQKAAELGREIEREKQSQQERQEERETEIQEPVRHTENSAERQNEGQVQNREAFETEEQVSPEAEQASFEITEASPNPQRVYEAIASPVVATGAMSAYQKQIQEIRSRAQSAQHSMNTQDGGRGM